MGFTRPAIMLGIFAPFVYMAVTVITEFGL
jgi:hypothetical protein